MPSYVTTRSIEEKDMADISYIYILSELTCVLGITNDDNKAAVITESMRHRVSIELKAIYYRSLLSTIRFSFNCFTFVYHSPSR